MLLDITVDADIVEVREYAKQGDFASMTYLATCLQKGLYTGQDKEKALALLNYVIAHEKDITERSVYWQALCQKSHLHEERNEEHIVDELCTILVRDMVENPMREWNYDLLESAIYWLAFRHNKE